jgi:hypothetical protein
VPAVPVTAPPEAHAGTPVEAPVEAPVGAALEEPARQTAVAGPAAADPAARTAADRRTLTDLGVPAEWAAGLADGDRFEAVLGMLDRLPEADIDPDTPVVAVVGPASAVRLEAHRVALDLAAGDEPRPVVVVPAMGAQRVSALTRARSTTGVVVAVEAAGREDLAPAAEALRAVGATAVVAVIEADRPVEETRQWLEALGRVRAVAVVGAGAAPAAALRLGVPVVRLDGIPLDRVTWTALLCAHLVAAEQAGRA